jgi:hypothetical protein
VLNETDLYCKEIKVTDLKDIMKRIFRGCKFFICSYSFFLEHKNLLTFNEEGLDEYCKFVYKHLNKVKQNFTRGTGVSAMKKGNGQVPR